MEGPLPRGDALEILFDAARLAVAPVQGDIAGRFRLPRCRLRRLDFCRSVDLGRADARPSWFGRVGPWSTLASSRLTGPTPPCVRVVIGTLRTRPFARARRATTLSIFRADRGERGRSWSLRKVRQRRRGPIAVDNARSIFALSPTPTIVADERGNYPAQSSSSTTKRKRSERRTTKPDVDFSVW